MHDLRRVDLMDLPWLLDQLRQFDQFFNSKYSLLPDEAYLMATVTHWIHTPSQYPFWVYTIDEMPVGFITGIMHQHFYRPELDCLTELLWWVVPGHRSGPAGPRLLFKFIEYGRLHAQWITMVVGRDTPVKTSTMERLGFVLRETNFLLEV